jgi:hypothetical protein
MIRDILKIIRDNHACSDIEITLETLILHFLGYKIYYKHDNIDYFHSIIEIEVNHINLDTQYEIHKILVHKYKNIFLINNKLYIQLQMRYSQFNIDIINKQKSLYEQVYLMNEDIMYHDNKKNLILYLTTLKNCDINETQSQYPLNL